MRYLASLKCPPSAQLGALGRKAYRRQLEFRWEMCSTLGPLRRALSVWTFEREGYARPHLDVPLFVATPGICVVLPPPAEYLSPMFLTPGVSKIFLLSSLVLQRPYQLIEVEYERPRGLQHTRLEWRSERGLILLPVLQLL